MAAETRDMPSEGQQMSLPRAASRAHGVCRLDAECFKPGEKAELLPDSPVSHLRCPDFINLHDIESSSADELTSSGSGELPAVEAADDDGLHETVQEVDARDLKTPDECALPWDRGQGAAPAAVGSGLTAAAQALLSPGQARSCAGRHTDCCRAAHAPLKHPASWPAVTWAAGLMRRVLQLGVPASCAHTPHRAASLQL